MRTGDLLVKRMTVSWTSVMTWLANGVPATVARLSGRLRIDDQARRKGSQRMYIATYMLSIRCGCRRTLEVDVFVSVE